MSRKNNNRNHRINRFIPFLQWLRPYNINTLRADSLAGLTVAVILIPQAMAYAMLAGMPPVYGLYAAAVTPMIGGLWGSLRQLATGPIAIMSLLVLTTLSPLALPGSPEYIELALLLSLIVGTLYLLIGFLQIGQVMSFISHSAVKGFTAAAAIIIIASQIPHLLGIQVERHEYIISMLLEIGTDITTFHPLTALIGILCFIFIYTVKKHRPAFPAALTALTISTLSVTFFKLYQTGVAVVGESPQGLPGFHMPLLDPETLSTLAGPAVVIALVSFAETYSVGKAISAETKQKIDVDQEFIGQGLANMLGGFFQCFPVSGSFSRTAINFTAGAKTGIASVIASIFVIVTLLFLTPLLTNIPKAGLAAVVISAVLTLFHPAQVFKLWKMNRDDGIVAVTVFVLALLTKPDYALLIGVMVSLIFFFWKTMHPRIVEITKDPAFNLFINADATGKPGCPQILHLRSDNVIFFANAEYTVEHILERVEMINTPLKFLLINFQAVGFIDITGIDELRRLKEELMVRGIQLAFFDVHQPVMKTFLSSGFSDEMKTGGMIEQTDLTSRQGKALAEVFKEIDHEYCRNSCPYKLFYECATVK
jgi:sulfate permease, SulP family